MIGDPDAAAALRAALDTVVAQARSAGLVMAPRPADGVLGPHPVAVAAKAAAKRRGSARRIEILPRGAVASVGCLFFDAEGRPCASSLDRRTIGISHDQLKAVPVRVGLAAGARKLEATLALAHGGVLDVLIIDAPLARSLLQATGGG